MFIGAELKLSNRLSLKVVIFSTFAAVPPRSNTSPKKRSVKKGRGTSKPRGRRKQRTRWPLALKLFIAAIVIITLSPLYYGYVLKTFTSSWQWIKDIGEDPFYRSYSRFGIKIPKGYVIHGIDVSYAQGQIDWHKVREMKDGDVEITFAFIKATEGLLTVDPYFKRNWREAAKTGIICGAYHYFRPKKSGTKQARFFLQTASVEQGDLPLVVDVETLDGKDPAVMRKELRAFVEHIQAKTKVKPVIYSGLSFYHDYLQGYFDDHILWIAHYHREELRIRKGHTWHFWQHSDRGKVSGINHAVDFNVFNGDSSSLKKLLIRK
ncbi:glycoside hydrolase family 25 protein [Arcticibacter sp.]|uniref:glycoside hydrolase family 25 protein n=1 Tax=Arcticibacter sp. TaxID=1872630 RepID=UPI00388E2B7B